MNTIFSENTDFFYANELIDFMKSDEIDIAGYGETEFNTMFNDAFGKVLEFHKGNGKHLPFIRMIGEADFEIVVSDYFKDAEEMNNFCLYHNLESYKEDECTVWYYDD